MIRRITWLAVVSPDLGQGSIVRVVMAIDMLSTLKLDVLGRHADPLAREAQFRNCAGTRVCGCNNSHTWEA